MYLGYLKYNTTFNSNIIMQRKIIFQQIVFANKKNLKVLRVKVKYDAFKTIQDEEVRWLSGKSICPTGLTFSADPWNPHKGGER